MIFFIITYKQRAVIVSSIIGREDAKRKARRWLGGDADNYTVEPITKPNEIITDMILVMD